MISSSGKLTNDLPTVAVGGCIAVGWNDHVTFLTINHQAHLDPHVFGPLIVLGIGSEPTHLEDQRSFGIIMKDNLRVGSVPIILITQSTSDTDHPRGKLFFAQDPSSNIHLMNPLVAQVSIACVAYPVPIVVEFLRIKGFRGAGPVQRSKSTCLGTAWGR